MLAVRTDTLMSHKFTICLKHYTGGSNGDMKTMVVFSGSSDCTNVKGDGRNALAATDFLLPYIVHRLFANIFSSPVGRGEL